MSPQDLSATASKATNYDGSSHVLYWADACSEVAFVVPSTIKPLEQSIDSSTYNSQGFLIKACNMQR